MSLNPCEILASSSPFPVSGHFCLCREKALEAVCVCVCVTVTLSFCHTYTFRHAHTCPELQRKAAWPGGVCSLYSTGWNPLPGLCPPHRPTPQANLSSKPRSRLSSKENLPQPFGSSPAPHLDFSNRPACLRQQALWRIIKNRKLY